MSDFDYLGNLPDDAIELIQDDPDRAITSWVFVSHTTADADFIKTVVLPKK